MKLTIFTQEEIQSKAQEILDQFEAQGWDYVVEYKYQVSASSAKEALHKILNQPEMLPPDKFSQALDHPMDRAGIGVSFGGIETSQYPYIEQLMATREYGPLNKDWESAREDVQTTLFLDGATEAENAAKHYITNKLRGPLKERFRVFQLVLIPVMKDNKNNGIS